MAVIIHREPIIEEIDLDNLLTRTLEMKKRGLRVGQICAAFVNNKYELSYTFVNDGNYFMDTLRIVIDLNEKVPSITEIYPYATFYENEMKELFGVNVELINLDYKNKLYRIDEETPFLSEAAKELRKEEIEAAEQAEKDTLDLRKQTGDILGNSEAAKEAAAMVAAKPVNPDARAAQQKAAKAVGAAVKAKAASDAPGTSGHTAPQQSGQKKEAQK